METAITNFLGHSLGHVQAHAVVEPHNTISCVLSLLEHTDDTVVVNNVARVIMDSVVFEVYGFVQISSDYFVHFWRLHEKPVCPHHSPLVWRTNGPEDFLDDFRADNEHVKMLVTVRVSGQRGLAVVTQTSSNSLLEWRTSLSRCNVLRRTPLSSNLVLVCRCARRAFPFLARCTVQPWTESVFCLCGTIVSVANVALDDACRIDVDFECSPHTVSYRWFARQF